MERSQVKRNLTWHVHSIRHKLGPEEKVQDKSVLEYIWNTANITASEKTKKKYVLLWRVVIVGRITTVIAFLILSSACCQ